MYVCILLACSLFGASGKSKKTGYLSFSPSWFRSTKRTKTASSNANPKNPENDENPPSNGPIPNQVTEENPIIYTTLVEHNQEEHAQELGNPDEYTQEPVDLDEQMKILFSEIIKDIRQLPSDYDNPKIQALKIALNKGGTTYEKKQAIYQAIYDFDVINIINNASYGGTKNPEPYIQTLVAEYRDESELRTPKNIETIINRIGILNEDRYIKKLKEQLKPLKGKSLEEKKIEAEKTIFHSDLIALKDTSIDNLINKIAEYHRIQTEYRNSSSR